jgi:broad specificity phosphatase PhoE
MSVIALRRGDTEWSLNGRHTGTTDIPSTDTERRAGDVALFAHGHVLGVRSSATCPRSLNEHRK